MTYAVKELFVTLQGEGARTGRRAVFCRFSGCNLWSGREEDRKSAVCRFCDTDFAGVNGEGGGRYEASALAARALSLWNEGATPFARAYIVCTGGEPLLQLDPPLIDAFHDVGFEIAVETNGTIAAPEGVDWLTVSPKAGATLKQLAGDELKLVFPQDEAEPERYAELDFDLFYLQPMDGPTATENTRRAIAYCLAHPRWRLSLQTHKIVGLR